MIGSAEAKRLESEPQLAEAKWQESERQLPGAKPLESESQLAETKRLESEPQLGDAKRLESEPQVGEAKRLESEPQVGEAKRLESEPQVGEAKRLESEPQVGEAKRLESGPQLAEAPASIEGADNGALAAPASAAEENVTGISVDKEKHVSMMKAWEEEQKNLLQHRAQKKMDSVTARENGDIAVMDAKLRVLEGSKEKKKERRVEKMKNKMARNHRQAEEKKASIEAKLAKQLLRIEELSATHLAKGTTPHKISSSWFCGRMFSRTHV